MTPPTPSPEQPEHEEARRLAVMRKTELAVIRQHVADVMRAANGMPTTTALGVHPLHRLVESHDALAALLSKAEQERDEAKDAYRAERDDLALEKKRFAALQYSYDRLVIETSQKLADTQREP